MKFLFRLITVFLIVTGAVADQSSRFGEIVEAFVHDTQNSKASPVARGETEWIVGVLQACSWQMHRSRMKVQQYVISFFDRSRELVASGQLLKGEFYLSAGQGVFVCGLTEQTASRIRQMQ